MNNGAISSVWDHRWQSLLFEIINDLDDFEERDTIKWIIHWSYSLSFLPGRQLYADCSI